MTPGGGPLTGACPAGTRGAPAEFDVRHHPAKFNALRVGLDEATVAGAGTRRNRPLDSEEGKILKSALSERHGDAARPWNLRAMTSAFIMVPDADPRVIAVVPFRGAFL